MDGRFPAEPPCLAIRLRSRKTALVSCRVFRPFWHLTLQDCSVFICTGEKGPAPLHSDAWFPFSYLILVSTCRTSACICEIWPCSVFFAVVMTDPEQPGTVREGGSDMNIRNGRIHDDMILIEPAKIRQRVGLLKYQKISNPGKAGQVSSRYVRGSLARRGEAARFILVCTRVTRH